MTVSVSTLPDRSAPRRMGGVSSIYLVAAAFLAVHLPFLAPSLEDFDSINFALGLHDFDPSRHQPHPPGSPVYIALGRVVFMVISAVRPALARTEADAFTLALISALSGAVALVAAYYVFSALSSVRAASRALWAAALLGVTPLFWLSGLRPMSDLPGLAAALSAQALILHARGERFLAYGALLAGIAAGIRLQTVWLTVPILVFSMYQHRRLGLAWLVSRPFAAFVVGGLLWAVPLVLDSGGPAGYLRALSTQAGEDFAWVSMLWLEPTPRKLAFTLYETGVLPWGSNVLAGVVAVAAVAGGLGLLVRDRRVLGLLLVVFAPYALFHLLFQETVTVRYALPTLPLVAYLATRGLELIGRRASFVAVPVIAGALIVAFPQGAAYGREPHPAFRAITAASRELESSRPAAVFSHQSVWRALQADSAGLPIVEPKRLYEWLGPVQYWKDGGNAAVWFLADSRRTDLALIDPEARRDVMKFEWAVGDLPEFSGSRPLGTDWYRIAPPGWFAGEGWALTPETGGLARATAAGPDHRPIEAWVRRRPGPLHLVVGGRHLGETGDPPEEFTLSVDGVERDRWVLTVEQRNFLRFLDLPDGVPGAEGTYALLTIASRSGGATEPRAFAAIRQFDLQSADRIVYGFGEGWHEEEYDPATGVRWRWTSERSTVRLTGPPSPLTLTVRGESPLRYFDNPPAVRILAGSRVVAQRAPEADFTWTVTLSRDDIASSGGALTIETDRVYLPGVQEGTADQRHLGLRLYEFRLDSSSP